MVDMFKAVRIFDEKIDTILTQFCWWSEVRYGKDNVWWAKCTLMFIFPLSSTLQNFVHNLEITLFSAMSSFLTNFFLSWLVFILFVNYFPPTKKTIEDAQKSPNKNKGNLLIQSLKIIAPFAGLFVFSITPLFLHFSPETIRNYFDCAFLVSVELILYFLCTEPIPPGEKRKRLEEKEKNRLQLSPQRN